MILNMSYGASQAQIIDFTVNEDFNIQNPYTVNNVKLSTGTVEGFYLQYKGTPSTINDLCVFAVFKGYRAAGVQGSLSYYHYRQDLSQYLYSDNNNNNAYIYDSSANTFSFKVNLGGAYLPAGNYRLVIW